MLLQSLRVSDRELVHGEVKVDESFVLLQLLQEELTDLLVKLVVGDGERQKRSVLRQELNEFVNADLIRTILGGELIRVEVELLEGLVQLKSLAELHSRLGAAHVSLEAQRPHLGVLAEVHSKYLALLVIDAHPIQIESHQRLVDTDPLRENAAADRAELEALQRKLKRRLVLAHHFEYESKLRVHLALCRVLLLTFSLGFFARLLTLGGISIGHTLLVLRNLGLALLLLPHLLSLDASLFRFVGTLTHDLDRAGIVGQNFEKFTFVRQLNILLVLHNLNIL